MKWHSRFLSLCDHIAQWSKDSTKIGCVIVDDIRRVVSLGYNGFPRGVADTEQRLEHRETKYHYVVHAEANAILNSRGSVRGCTLYCVHLPCAECTKLIIQAGIHRVATRKRWPEEQRWSESIATLKEAGVEVLLVE